MNTSRESIFSTCHECNNNFGLAFYFLKAATFRQRGAKINPNVTAADVKSDLFFEFVHAPPLWNTSMLHHITLEGSLAYMLHFFGCTHIKMHHNCRGVKMKLPFKKVFDELLRV